MVEILDMFFIGGDVNNWLDRFILNFMLVWEKEDVLNINIFGEIGKRYIGDRKDRYVGSRIWL